MPQKLDKIQMEDFGLRDHNSLGQAQDHAPE